MGDKKLLTVLIILGPVTVLIGLLSMGSNAQGPSYNIYFGNLHSHTGYSDGSGTPAQAYQHAKNSGAGDFLAITDHAHMMDEAEWADTKIQGRQFYGRQFCLHCGI